jgi:hypothetical protein
MQQLVIFLFKHCSNMNGSISYNYRFMEQLCLILQKIVVSLMHYTVSETFYYSRQ